MSIEYLAFIIALFSFRTFLCLLNKGSERDVLWLQHKKFKINILWFIVHPQHWNLHIPVNQFPITKFYD